MVQDTVMTLQEGDVVSRLIREARIGSVCYTSCCTWDGHASERV